MAGPKGLDFRANIGQRAVATGVFGDILGAVIDVGRDIVGEVIRGTPRPPIAPPIGRSAPSVPRLPPIGTGSPVGDPVSVDPTPFTGEPFEPAGGCLPFMTPDPITGECRFDIDPGPGQGLPGGGAGGGTGLNRPQLMARNVLVCPTFADGKKGILWMNALTGDVVCLPRRTSGKGFGLIRKNPPRKKAFITAAEKASLTKMKRIQGRAKKFASDAGFTCKRK